MNELAVTIDFIFIMIRRKKNDLTQIENLLKIKQ